MPGACGPHDEECCIARIGLDWMLDWTDADPMPIAAMRSCMEVRMVIGDSNSRCYW